MGIKKNPLGTLKNAAKAVGQTAEMVASKTAEAVPGLIDEASKRASQTAEGATELAGNVADSVQEGLTVANDVKNSARYDYRMKKYNPLFPEEYADPSFDRPKIIVIRDEDLRKGIDVCEGAIGWMETKVKPEIMCLYEEAIEMSCLSFYPRATCDAVYLRDPYDFERYIELSQYIDICRRDQISELKMIARCLGAKECSLKVFEKESIQAEKNTKVDLKGNLKAPKMKESVGLGGRAETSSLEDTSKSIVFFERMTGDVEPTKPKLRYFRNDVEINSLIANRLGEESANIMTEYSIDVTASSNSTMSANYAETIDASLKGIGVKLGVSLQTTYKKETSKRFIYSVVF
ncbi:MAG: hypothetical protein ACI4BI_02230 [Anaerotardibacter sp.]